MQNAVIIVFIIGYIFIAFEQRLRVNKTATALLTGVLCWVIFIMWPDEAMASPDFPLHVQGELSKHLSSISEILFFLLGAMTIVELIDAHHGFRFITGMIKTKRPVVLLWTVCIITFFLSAVLDNLTTTIVMVSLVRKLISDRDVKLLFIGMVIIAANAGGAWSPIGDVTTTMLWNGGQITSINVMKTLLLPSIVSLLVPLIYTSFFLKTEIISPDERRTKDHEQMVNGGKLMLILGILVMVGVPAFKVVTHLPPYIGMIAGLGLIWVVSELIHPELDDAMKRNYTAAGALSRIDVPSILFFLGILLAVSAMESMHILQHFSNHLSVHISNNNTVVTLIGLVSSIVDNVPLVAASMGMYSLQDFPTDNFLWQYLAYCTGTGGSILIIGSAAGVAAMGMENIDFLWYLKKFSVPALLGFFAGAGVCLLLA
jgi:Na+/H+ antiporter NhaD/arsenite permease-like protein